MKELELPPDEVRALREKEAYPIIREFEKWLERETSSTTPQSSIGKAVRYAYALYPRMARYVTDGRYRIDNNGAENAVRPLALGRKNYLFCRNHEAAYHAAIVQRGPEQEFGVKAKRQKPLRSSLRSTTSPVRGGSGCRKTLVGASIARPCPFVL